jgi:DNA-binding response OmpR family regulator
MPKVLIVDDDPDIVDSLKLILSAEGYAVAAATSREEAMRGVEKEKPDLIILDVMMEQPDDGPASQGCEDAHHHPVLNRPRDRLQVR